ncbi:MAG: hypothetical protein ACT4PX_06885 [Actinomycetota bacterium]
MTQAELGDLRSLEGRRVGVALADRTCIDEAVLEAVVSGKLWLHTAGEDVFVPVPDVVDVWEIGRP